MRVLIVNTSERTGGAAVAAGRLMDALRMEGVDCRMLVADKQSDSSLVAETAPRWRRKLNFLFERLIIYMRRGFTRRGLFSVDPMLTGTDITSHKFFKEADVVHLHWVGQGMLSHRDIEKIICSGKAVVWTMHDMWATTGASHLMADHNDKSDRLAQSTFRKKQKLYSLQNITFVSCSQWLEKIARRSPLLSGQDILTIPNPIDTTVFSPGSRQEARRRLGLPLDKKMMLFGAVNIGDKLKGADYLIQACNLLDDMKGGLELLIIGNASESLCGAIPLTTHNMGYISSDERLVDIYRAADIFVTPSLLENLPNMIMEAMSTGTPCVGFRVGGIPEMIDDGLTGRTAEYKSASSLACCIRDVLADDGQMRLASREKAVREYSQATVARKFIQLYNKKLK